MKTKIIGCLMILAVLISCCTVTSFATEQIYKAYNFDSADFYINFNKDGSATVTEVWKVTYRYGEYHAFYKNIYLELPQTESFQIEFVEVWVDGNKCSLTTNTENPAEYTYAVINKKDILTYEVYATSKEQTREYRITYILHNVVKCFGDEYYLFEYRLLPKGYKETINDFNVFINTPDGITDTKCSSTLGRVVKNESIHISAQNVYGLFKVNLKMYGDKSIFNITNPNSYIGTLSLDNHHNIIVFLKDIAKDNLGSFLKPVILIVFFLLLLILVLLANLKRTQRVNKIKQEMKKDPQFVEKSIAQCQYYGFSPADIASIGTDNEYLIYFAYLAELANLNIIQFSSDYQTIIYPETFNYLPEQNLILEVLEDCRVRNAAKGYHSQNINNHWHLPFSYVEKNFEEYIAYLKIQGTLQRILNIKIENFNTRYGKIEQEKLEDYFFTFEIIANKQNAQLRDSIIEFSTILNQYNYNSLLLLSYCCQEKKKKRNVIRDNSGHITNCAINLYITMKVFEWEQKHQYDDRYDGVGGSSGGGSSSSGGGSSSSSGGCGGCGGVR